MASFLHRSLFTGLLYSATPAPPARLRYTGKGESSSPGGHAWLRHRRSNGRRLGRLPASRFSLSSCSAHGSSRVSYSGAGQADASCNFRDVNGITVPVKLDFDSAGFVANKLVHALPGTLWIQGPLEWSLQYPLAALPPTAIRNSYPYVWASHFKAEKIGFSGQTGARATITLPPPDERHGGTPHALVLEAINEATGQATLGAR